VLGYLAPLLCSTWPADMKKAVSEDAAACDEVVFKRSAKLEAEKKLNETKQDKKSSKQPLLKRLVDSLLGRPEVKDKSLSKPEEEEEDSKGSGQDKRRT